jgi:peroxiredoxin
MTATARFSIATLVCIALSVAALGFTQAQTDPTEPIIAGLRGLRKLSDSDRVGATRTLAMQIRALPAGKRKVDLALSLATLSTEGDFGRDTIQSVTDTLVQALKETPQAPDKGKIYYGYTELAQLAKYEDMAVDMEAPDFRTAAAELAQIDAARAKADFTLTDLKGNEWTLSSLKGKVVLVNFWATWCPPCRKEMPDLNTLYNRFKDQGFVILAMSDEERSTVEKYIGEHPVDYPILLDPDRKANAAYKIEGIPKSFIYDRAGKMVAQTIDMRTMDQFLQLLEKAGLK